MNIIAILPSSSTVTAQSLIDKGVSPYIAYGTPIFVLILVALVIACFLANED